MATEKNSQNEEPTPAPPDPKPTPPVPTPPPQKPTPEPEPVPTPEPAPIPAPEPVPLPTNGNGHSVPRLPTPDEEIKRPVAPAAIDPSVVETTESGLKFGWQHAPNTEAAFAEPCYHMGIVQARKQVKQHEVGHEWVCVCGQVFVVLINSGDKKTLVEKDG